MMIGNEGKKWSYVDALKGPIEKEEYKLLKEDAQNPTMIILKKNIILRGKMPSTRPLTLRYQNIFLGVCYSCNNFGQKVINSRVYARGRNTRNSYENPKNYYEGSYGRKSCEVGSQEKL